MTHFNIVHVIRDGLLGVRAYQETIDSILWGLQQLGHEATYSVNSICHDATNIIVGGHLFPELLVESPEGTIYYNLEQIRGHPQYSQSDPHPVIKLILHKFQVWDYSIANIETWNGLTPERAIKFVPIGYAPVLTRIENAERQDIDILFYGSVGERRLSVFSSVAKLVDAGISTVFACGLYGAGRDSLIARSKIVLNINHYSYAKIFEIVRVSYLLANSKAVIADVSPDSYIEEDIVGGVIFVPIEQIAEACKQLLANEERRTQLERQGFECISQRDIRIFLSAALA